MLNSSYPGHLSPIRRIIFSELETNPGQRYARSKGRIKELAANHGIQDISADQALVDLAKMGLIQKERKGRNVHYYYTDKQEDTTKAFSGGRTIIYFRDANSHIIASVASLPGCIADGSSVEEAGQNIRGVIRGYLASIKHQGGHLPEEVGVEHINPSEYGNE